jgi:hypothetical protein
MTTGSDDEHDELFCWKVQGISDEYTGYYAEEEAMAVAKRIGGSCFAFALYVKPQPQPTREWVGLTDDEVGDAANNANTYTEAVQMTQTKLKEKNT